VKRHKMTGTGELPLNMTPMIDVVFNLIIFFMIVVDLTQQELEDITLPRASECLEDKPEKDEKRKIVNIDWDGKIIVKRAEMNLAELENNLARWRNIPGMLDEQGFCDQPILIRTDRGTEMKYCQKIMQICGKETLKIWKIQLACAKDAPGYQPVEDPKMIPETGDDEDK